MLEKMTIEELREDIAREQKKGLPFIIASVIIWGLITIVTLLDIPLMTKNFLVFCCSCPLMPLAILVSKIIHVDIFSKRNPLNNLGLLFTLNQFLYILIVMWAYRAAPERMIMIYGMVFGAHLLPYSWLYNSKAYRTIAIIIPIMTLVLGYIVSSTIIALVLCLTEIVFVMLLFREVKELSVQEIV